MSERSIASVAASVAVVTVAGVAAGVALQTYRNSRDQQATAAFLLPAAASVSSASSEWSDRTTDKLVFSLNGTLVVLDNPDPSKPAGS